MQLAAMQVSTSSLGSRGVYTKHKAEALACRVQPSSRGASRISTVDRLNAYSATQYETLAAPATQQQQHVEPTSSNALSKLQPISRALEKELQREQRQKKRLRRQLAQLQRHLVLHSAGQNWLTNLPASRSFSDNSAVSSGSSIEDVLEQLSDDPLFNSSAPSSVEQLQRKLLHVRRQLLQASSDSLADISTVTAKLQDFASCLQLPLDLVVPMVARCEPLLLQPAEQLPPRLTFLSTALQLPQLNTAELVAATAPQLLATPLHKLAANFTQLQRVLASRGLDAASMLQERPDLLCQNPSTIEAKLEQLPAALGMNRQHVRELVGECPQLLRRSVATIQHRFRSLCQLFNIPEAFVQEFVVQEPELLCISASTLKAKFDSLLVRYGAFADDVVDMVLVDPAMLLNADPATAPKAPTVRASRKKQQQQQQQQASGSVADAETVESGSSSSSSDSIDEPDSSATDLAASAAVDVSEPEQWQLVLQQRREKQKAAKARQRLRRQLKQQLEQQWLAADDQLQVQQQLMMQWADMQMMPEMATAAAPAFLQVPSTKAPGGAVRQSPVRQLLSFAAATGLSPSQAVLLWQEEPALAQLPTAVVAAQVSRLSAALGLESRTATSTLQQQLPGASSGTSRPVLQVLVKEPGLLILPPGQLRVNMKGLCDLLSLDLQQGLLPLLWQQPGLLQLAPEVAEYRLQHLAGLLQLSVPRTLGLALQQPRLLVERPVLLAARLGSLCTMLGVQRGVASECALREPMLLCMDDDVLQVKWQQLCERVGGWEPDAVDVVLADPSALIRADLF